MASKAQREARRRYAITQVRAVMGPDRFDMANLAALLNEKEVLAPLGTTEWTPRLVAALLVCDALESGKAADWLGRDAAQSLLWRLNARSALAFFNPEELGFPALLDAFKAAFGELHLTDMARHWELQDAPEDGGAVRPRTSNMVSLTPDIEALRDYALHVLGEMADQPLTYAVMATLLSRMGVPCPDGRTSWHHNQVERLVAHSGDSALKQWFACPAPTGDFANLDSMEQAAADAALRTPGGLAQA